MSKQKKLLELRSHMVVKGNDLIQNSRFNLQLQEQKIILYLISKIKPDDIELKEYVFEILEFCQVCGLDADNGTNYRNIRQTLKDLRDKSLWVTLQDGSETTLAWIDRVTMNRNSGTVKIKIDDMMKPYLLQLRERFTQYELMYTLGMKSQYSLRLYELMKSYEFQHGKVFDIEDLKVRLSAVNYARYPDFKRKVLDIAMREINSLTDINVTYEIIKESRRYAKIMFAIKLKKDLDTRMETWKNIDQVINGKERKTKINRKTE